MSCTRVLHAIGSCPQPAALPVDLAKCLSRARRPPLDQLLPASSPKANGADTLPRAGLHAPSCSSVYQHSPPPREPSARPRSCFRQSRTTSNKKRVVFADALGLALAAVRLFIPETPPPDSTLLTKSTATRLQGQQLLSSVQEQQQRHQQQQQQQQQQQRYKPRLGFPPPMTDLKGFLARLRGTGVHLQSCSVSEQSLTGNVSVSHVTLDQVVTVKVTFDSWRSHRHVPCTFLQRSRFGGSDIDVFAFSLCLPRHIDPKEQVEFCVHVSRGPGLAPLVDDNMGQNYGLRLDTDGPSEASRFYPTLSKRPSRSPLLSASVGEQSAGERPCFQRSLLSGVGGEGSAGNWSRVYPAFAMR